MAGHHRILQVGVDVDDKVALWPMDPQSEASLSKPLDLVVKDGQAMARPYCSAKLYSFL